MHIHTAIEEGYKQRAHNTEHRILCLEFLIYINFTIENFSQLITVNAYNTIIQPWAICWKWGCGGGSAACLWYLVRTNWRKHINPHYKRQQNRKKTLFFSLVVFFLFLCLALKNQNNSSTRRKFTDICKSAECV